MHGTTIPRTIMNRCSGECLDFEALSTNRNKAVWLTFSAVVSRAISLCLRSGPATCTARCTCSAVPLNYVQLETYLCVWKSNLTKMQCCFNLFICPVQRYIKSFLLTRPLVYNFRTRPMWTADYVSACLGWL